MPDRYVYNYNKDEWDFPQSKIKDAPPINVVKNASNIDDAGNEWLAIIEQLMSSAISKVRAKSQLHGLTDIYDINIASKGQPA